MFFVCFFFQAEDGIRDLVRSRGLGDVYKRQVPGLRQPLPQEALRPGQLLQGRGLKRLALQQPEPCLLYTSDAADERSSVDLGGRRIIKKKKRRTKRTRHPIRHTIIATDHDTTKYKQERNHSYISET